MISGGFCSPGLRAGRRLTKRAFRQRERAFLAEGPQAVAEAFNCGALLTDLFVTVPARGRHSDLVTAIAGAGIPVHLVSGEIMDELAQTVTPQGLLAVCGFIDVPLTEVTRPGPAPTLVALLANVRAQIGDHGRAGADGDPAGIARGLRLYRRPAHRGNPPRSGAHPGRAAGERPRSGQRGHGAAHR